MNTNVHYAMGLIIASITCTIYSLSIWEFMFIVICAAGPDVDFLFSKYAKDENHRNFITHSILIPTILLVVGIIIEKYYFIPIWFIGFHQVIWIGGVAYFSHLALDLIDWGINPFYFGKTIGFFILLTQDEKNLAHPRTIIEREKKKDPNFFILRYYNNPTIVSIDLIISIIGFFMVFVFASQFWYVPLGLFVLVEYHLHEKKKAEDKK
jgi:hypothetical protein